MRDSLLRRRDVRLIVGSVGLSALGDFLALVPLALLLQERSGSGLVVSGLLIALWCPVIVLAPLAGLVADRVDNRRLLLWGSLAQALVALALAASLDSTVAVIALTALLGTAFAFVQPAEFALVPVVAGSEERLTEMNGHVETARYAGMTVGPLAGGFLSAAGGAEVAMLVNAGTFLAVAVAAALLRVTRRPERLDGAKPDRARDGAAALVSDPVLRLVMPVAFIALLFMTASATAEVFFAKDVLDAGDTGYGALITAWTLGMVCGAAGVARRVGAVALAPVALAAMVLQGAGIALPTLWLVLGFGLAMYFAGGLGHGLKNVLLRSLIQSRVPERLHGRASAAYNALRNGAELVALVLGGVLVAAIGARTTLAIAGGVPAVVALAALVRSRWLREARRRSPVQPGAEPLADTAETGVIAP